MATDHVHEWEPIPGWYARYRCIGCLALGYKQKTVTSFGSTEIVPYLCQAQADKLPCGQPVVYAAGEYPRLCPKHEAARVARGQRRRR